ncbi:MAG: hypothetical protein RL386_695 [Bacteroidota bacterium]
MSEEVKEQLSAKVKLLMTYHNNTPSSDTTSLESEIDQLVYALYGLTEAEIGIIEGRGIVHRSFRQLQNDF